MKSLKVTAVRIERFRRIQAPLTLVFQGPAGGPLNLVVLAGPNGCGKTTVLEAILLALGRGDLIARGLPSANRDDNPRLWIPPEARIEVDVTVTGDDGVDGDFTFAHHGPAWEVRKRLAPGQASILDGPSVRSLLDGRPVEYYSSWRAPALVGAVTPQVAGRPPADTEANRLWLLKQRLLNLRVRATARGNVPIFPDRLPDRLWVERLNQAWKAFRDDGTTLDLDLEAPDNPDHPGWDLFVFRGRDRVCAVDALSSGEIEILALVAPHVAEPLTGVILIDEPELHLHPEWQGRIIPALQALSPDAQIIAATHAEEPWDRAYTFQRFLLVPDDDPRSSTWRNAHHVVGE